MSNETPLSALASAIHEEGKVWENRYMEVNSDEIAKSILDYLKNEGGWELVKIIPKSMPFTGIYPPGTK